MDCEQFGGIESRVYLLALSQTITISRIYCYYAGTDDQSQSMDQTWQDGRVISACEQVVAVKLLAERLVDLHENCLF